MALTDKIHILKRKVIALHNFKQFVILNTLNHAVDLDIANLHCSGNDLFSL